MFLPHIVYPALRLILVNRLQKVANSYEKTLCSAEPSNLQPAWNDPQQGNQTVWAEIPLKRMQKKNQICYASALALKLAKLWQKPALDIANYIAETLNQEKSLKSGTDHPLGSILQNCSIDIAPPGWIYLELHKNSVAAWLQIVVNLLPHATSSSNTAVGSPRGAATLANLPVAESCNSESCNSIEIFESLHSYARCASLLRLAEQADLIQLNEFSQRSTVGWRIVAPSSLPWLQEDGNLRCQHPTEQQLIAQLIDVTDELALELWIQDTGSTDQTSNFRGRKVQLSKTLQNLTQAFQAFHRDCQILSEIKTTDRDLAQVRCGLISITHLLLHHLLQATWGIEPPIEL